MGKLRFDEQLRITNGKESENHPTPRENSVMNIDEPLDNELGWDVVCMRLDM